jgi:ABC-type lipoprotein export system ATPase subunit
MPVIDILNETHVSPTARMKMLSGIFDCPVESINKFELHDHIDIESQDYNIGAIIGPSGCGKSSILKVMGEPVRYDWSASSVIDSFSKEHSIQDVAECLNSVGFGNVKAWMRPFHVLSNGEQFRAQCARAIMESEGTIYIDEFTSVVDRQVAKIACHAIQKHIRKANKKMIVATCHEDVIDWLQPDWYYEPHVKKFTRRLLRRRPDVEVEIYETKHSSWKMFAPFHYMSADLHKSARCYILFADGMPASFAGVLHRPISAKGKRVPVWGVSRLVTHPDFQGIGLAFVLLESLGDLYAKDGKRLRTYPAHPVLVKNFHKNKRWRCIKNFGATTSINRTSKYRTDQFGGRINAVFEYMPQMVDAT